MPEFSKLGYLKAVAQFKLSAAEHAVLMHIVNKADGITGENAWVTDASMAKATGRGVRSVQRATSRLSKELRLIERTQRGIQGARPSIYRLTMPTEVTRQTASNPPKVTRHDDGVTRHSCRSNPPLVAGISDPVIRSPKGSDSEESDHLPATTVAGVVASLPIGEGQQEMSEPSPRGSVSATGGSDPQESEPSDDVSSSSIGTRQSVPLLPDTAVSGVGDQPSIEASEAMNKLDPWAPTATAPSPLEDPFGPQPRVADDVDYGAMYEEHLASVDWQPPEPRPVRAMVMHSMDCLDAGPWPDRPVDCKACAAERP